MNTTTIDTYISNHPSTCHRNLKSDLLTLLHITTPSLTPEEKDALTSYITSATSSARPSCSYNCDDRCPHSGRAED